MCFSQYSTAERGRQGGGDRAAGKKKSVRRRKNYPKKTIDKKNTLQYNMQEA
jgi:hypothetical protein